MHIKEHENLEASCIRLHGHMLTLKFFIEIVTAIILNRQSNDC